MKRAAALLLFSALLSQPVHADEIAAGIGFDTLTNNYQSWQHQYLRGNKILSEKANIRAEVRNYQRFNLTNTEFSVGGFYQLSTNTSVDFELGTTPDADFRPEQRFSGQIYHQYARGKGVALGYEFQAWPTRDVSTVFIEPDFYVGNYRFAYRLSSIQPDGLSTELGHRISVARYYQQRSYITVALATGREVEAIGTQVIVAEVNTLALYGRHEWRGPWSVEYSLGFSEQGDFYNRTGIELGLHYQF